MISPLCHCHEDDRTTNSREVQFYMGPVTRRLCVARPTLAVPPRIPGADGWLGWPKPRMNIRVRSAPMMTDRVRARRSQV